MDSEVGVSTASWTCTCAGVTADVALHADAAQGLVEALWAAFHTQPGALQLQQWRRTPAAGSRTRTRAQLAGRVALLTAGAVPVVPTHGQRGALVTPAWLHDAKVIRFKSRAGFISRWFYNVEITSQHGSPDF